MLLFFFSSRRRHTRCSRDWSSDVCSSDLPAPQAGLMAVLAKGIVAGEMAWGLVLMGCLFGIALIMIDRSEEHTSELQSRLHLVCRLLLEKKKQNTITQPQLYAVVAAHIYR